MATLEERVGKLESRFAVATALAIALGLGGAGIGGLLVKAYSQIGDLEDKSKGLNTKLDETSARLEYTEKKVAQGISNLDAKTNEISKRLDGTEGKIIDDITKTGQQKLVELKEIIPGLLSKIKIEQHRFCTSDREDAPCGDLPRFDTDEIALDAVAAKLCGSMRHSAPHWYAGGSGGRHGWAHYDVTCISVE